MDTPIVSPDWVASRADDLIIVDVREDWEYEGIGHLPGAVNLPFEAFRADDHSQGEAGMLPGADLFASLVGRIGLSTTDRLVGYDDSHGVFAARLLVTAELYSHDPGRLHLLNGDFTAWSRDRAVSQTSVTPNATTYEASFDPTGPLIDTAGIEASMDDSDVVFVDTRTQAEFAEGHLPGAVQLDWLGLVDRRTRGMKEEPTVQSILDDRGITPERSVVLYCNTARRLSHTYTVLRHLGYPDISFYEGSLAEWSRLGRSLEAEN